MRFVFTSYIASRQFTHPQHWLKRINIYAGLLEHLAKTDEVISIEQIDFEGDVQHNGVQYLFRRFTETELLFPRKLHRLIKSLQPDVVLVHGLHFPLQVIQLRKTLGASVKIILQHHAEVPAKRVRKYLQRRADKVVDAYLFASKEMGMNWVQHGNLTDAKKIHEVMEVSSVFYPINRQTARDKTNVGDGHVFLWVGHLDKNKDPLTVVQGFLQFALDHPLARLFMIYRKEDLLANVQQLLAAHATGVNVTLVGPVPHDELLYWFNSADFVISGSHYEGAGTAVCEALSCGCIPVITNIPSFRMMTDNGRCGILFESGNVASLVVALKRAAGVNMPTMRASVLKHYTATLSFGAIASRVRSIAGSL